MARRHNEREATGDPTAHAEVLALRDAAAVAGERRLPEASLVVTLEPCPMCAGAAWAAQVGRVVFGAADLKAGADGLALQLRRRPAAQPQSEVVPGVRADECAALLTALLRRASLRALDLSRLLSSPEGCRSGRTGRSRKPLWLQDHRGFKSHTLRQEAPSDYPARDPRHAA